MASPPGSVHVKDGEGTALWFLGMLLEVKADGAAMGGPTVVQFTVPPGPVLCAPPYIHDCEEVVYVLEGRLRFHVGDRAEGAGPGSVLFFPKGATEWFENLTQQRGKILTMYNGGHMAGFFREVGAPAKTRVLPPPPAGPPELGKLASIGSRHGLPDHGSSRLAALPWLDYQEG